MSENNDKIQEKIRHLLALATSPNEHEARSALLKARKLMAKYKILEHDLENIKDQEVKRVVTDIDYSSRRDPWVYSLAYVIAKNHCCEAYQLRKKGKQTCIVGFVGFETDAGICKDLFCYAVDSVRAVTKKLKKDGVKKADGYGFGFAVGLGDAYKKQEKEEGWALVLVTPKEVTESMSDMKSMSSTSSNKMKSSDARAFMKGMDDGRKFHEQKRLKGAENE